MARTLTRKNVSRDIARPTLGDLLAKLGDITPDRICMDPAPGTATKRDVVQLQKVGGKLYELVEGTLVEKPMGAPESFLALELAFQLRLYLQQHNIGYLLGADGMIELAPRLVREPDVCFVSWSKTPDGKVLRDAISDCIPDLAVEILSPSNTSKEMDRKVGEYFRAGVRLVWIIDPETESAEVYTSTTEKAYIPNSGILDGSDVLPGFKLSLTTIFAKVTKPAAKKPRKKK